MALENCTKERKYIVNQGDTSETYLLITMLAKGTSKLVVERPILQ